MGGWGSLSRGHGTHEELSTHNFVDQGSQTRKLRPLTAPLPSLSGSNLNVFEASARWRGVWGWGPFSWCAQVYFWPGT